MGETWLRKLFETKKERNETKLLPQIDLFFLPLYFRCGPKETKLLLDPRNWSPSLPLCSSVVPTSMPLHSTVEVEVKGVRVKRK